MSEFKHRHWGQQIEAIVGELSRLAMVCDIELGKPGLAERVLDNDESVCRRRNPEVFQKIRRHLMALLAVEERAIERLGVDQTREILDQVRAALTELRSAGGPGVSLPRQPDK